VKPARKALGGVALKASGANAIIFTGVSEQPVTVLIEGSEVESVDARDRCIFAIAPTRIMSLPEMASMLAAVTGWKTSDYEVMRIGERRNHLMHWSNLREGLTAADDTLPDRFFEEPLAAGKRQGDVLNRHRFQRDDPHLLRVNGLG